MVRPRQLDRQPQQRVGHRAGEAALHHIGLDRLQTAHAGGSQVARDAMDTQAIAAYNERLNTHPMLTTTTVPLRDRVAIAVKRQP